MTRADWLDWNIEKEAVVSLELTLLRVTPATYDNAMRADGDWDGTGVAENGQVGKAWNILAYLLAGPDREHPEPAAEAIVGGERIPDSPDEFGGIRALAPAQVAEVSAALGHMAEDEFRRRYDTYDFTGAYNADGARPGWELESCLRIFGHLRHFYREAAEAGDAVIVWVG